MKNYSEWIRLMSLGILLSLGMGSISIHADSALTLDLEEPQEEENRESGSEASLKAEFEIEVSNDRTITWIGKQAFRGCESLTEIELPENLESLVRQGRHFMDCVSLERIVIPDGVTDIPQHTFSGCINLKEVILPANLESIQQSAFQDCKSLEEITIPAGVRELRGGRIFSGCDNLQKIIFLGDAPEVLGSDHFPAGVKIYRRAGVSGWPDAGQNWNGQPTAVLAE